MATYTQIQWIKEKYGFTVKTCWIAHAKEVCGLEPRIAPNRHNVAIRLNPYPDMINYRSFVKHLNILT